MAQKAHFAALLRPLLGFLRRLGVTPNHLTLVALGGSIATGLLVALFPFPPMVLLLPGWVVFRLALNTLDGMMARTFSMTSKLGALLNESADALSDAALLLPLSLVPGISPTPVVLLAVLGLCSEVTGLAALQLGVARRYDGPLTKPERLAVVSGLALLVGLGVSPAPWMTILLYATLPLSAWTVVRRIRRALCLANAPTTQSSAQGSSDQ